MRSARRLDRGAADKRAARYGAISTEAGNLDRELERDAYKSPTARANFAPVKRSAQQFVHELTAEELVVSRITPTVAVRAPDDSRGEGPARGDALPLANL
jgi:hypothetical protein